MPVPQYVKETAVVRRVASSPECRWIYTNHAEERMRQRDVSYPDVETVLINGQVTLIETNKPDILWRVEGIDLDGRRLRVEAAVFEDAIEVKIVTVF